MGEPQPHTHTMDDLHPPSRHLWVGNLEPNAKEREVLMVLVSTSRILQTSPLTERERRSTRRSKSMARSRASSTRTARATPSSTSTRYATPRAPSSLSTLDNCHAARCLWSSISPRYRSIPKDTHSRALSLSLSLSLTTKTHISVLVLILILILIMG